MTPNRKLCIAFQQLDTPPKTGLELAIIHAVEERNLRDRRVRLVTYSGILALSVAAVVPAIMSLGSQLSQSGFFQYLSLAISDGGTMWAIGKDFGFLLAESLPVMSLLLVGGILMIGLWSLKKIPLRSFIHQAANASLNRIPSYESIA